MKKEKKNRLIVGDIGWAETLPDWLLEAIKTERLALGLMDLICEDAPKVGEAEVCAYLYTASLHAPMSHEHSQIYFYIGARVMKSHQPDQDLPEMMVEALEQGLHEWEERELENIRDLIYRKRGGKIVHPVLDAMRILKKGIEKAERVPQLKFL